MKKHFAIWVVLVLLMTIASACSSESDSQTIAESLADRLANALPGDIVEAEPGVYDGPFTVPPGVTLTAKEPGTVSIVGEDEGFVIKLESYDDPPTELSNIDISSLTDVGIVVGGNQAAKVKDVKVTTASGMAFVGEGLDELTLESVELVGKRDSRYDIEYPIDPAILPAAGLVLSGVSSLDLKEVDISGFSGFAAILDESQGSWSGGTMQDNVGLGLFQQGGEMLLDDLSIVTTSNCFALGCAVQNQVYGLAVTGGGILRSSGLSVSDNDGIGMFLHQSASSHEALQAKGNSHAGLWIQDTEGQENTSALEITGQDNDLSDNAGGGVVLLNTGNLNISNTQIKKTVSLPVSCGETCWFPMGDGIHASKLSGDLSLSSVTLSDNTRVGLLLSEISEGQPEISMENVQITGETGNGLITQSGIESSEDWDVAVSETLAANDALVTDPLETAAEIEAVPSAQSIQVNGLLGEQGLIDDQGKLQHSVRVDRFGRLFTDE